MSNPQRENGFTGIANEILDAVACRKFNGTQFRLLTVIWRYTYGFQRKSHPFSHSFLHERTGLSKDSIKRGIKGLINKHVLVVVKEPGFSSARELAFNKDYDQWNVEIDADRAEESIQREEGNGGGESSPSSGDQNTPSPGGKLDPHRKKEKEIKTEKDNDEARAGDVFQFYETNFGGRMTDYHRDFLGGWCDDLSPDIVLEALKITLLNHASSLKYTARILNEWDKNNVHRLPDVLRYEKEKNGRKETSNDGQGRRNHRKSPPQSARSKDHHSITGGQIGWIKPRIRA
ncbi:replication protein [Salibacterium salarium]|uniref:replication protein n=1 Tax=Salibacterium salarium TaxID=284579 RepID=UPI000F76CB2F|nr:replication protein [Salibacterium salarium]